MILGSSAFTFSSNSEGDFADAINEESSAKDCTGKLLQLGKSFIYTRKSSTPITDPWGTPNSTDSELVEIEPFTATRCVLFCKNDLNQE